VHQEGKGATYPKRKRKGKDLVDHCYQAFAQSKWRPPERSHMITPKTKESEGLEQKAVSLSEKKKKNLESHFVAGGREGGSIDKRTSRTRHKKGMLNWTLDSCENIVDKKENPGLLRGGRKAGAERGTCRGGTSAFLRMVKRGSKYLNSLDLVS